MTHVIPIETVNPRTISNNVVGEGDANVCSPGLPMVLIYLHFFAMTDIERCSRPAYRRISQDPARLQNANLK